MKRVLGSLIVAIIVFSVVLTARIAPNAYAAASSGPGDVVCQVGAVSLGWRLTTASDGSTRVSGIDVRDVDQACSGLAVTVALLDGPAHETLFRGTLEPGTTHVREYLDGQVWRDAVDGRGPAAEAVVGVRLIFADGGLELTTGAP